MHNRTVENDTTQPDFFAVLVPGKGAHHFRVPTGSRHNRNMLFASELPYQGMPKALVASALTLGTCWAHELREFDTEYPSDPSDTALHAYAQAIERELQMEGWKPVTMMALANLVGKVVNDRLAVDEEALKLAVFTLLPKDGPTS